MRSALALAVCACILAGAAADDAVTNQGVVDLSAEREIDGEFQAEPIVFLSDFTDDVEEPEPTRDEAVARRDAVDRSDDTEIEATMQALPIIFATHLTEEVEEEPTPSRPCIHHQMMAMTSMMDQMVDQIMRMSSAMSPPAHPCSREIELTHCDEDPYPELCLKGNVDVLGPSCATLLLQRTINDPFQGGEAPPQIVRIRISDGDIRLTELGASLDDIDDSTRPAEADPSFQAHQVGFEILGHSHLHEGMPHHHHGHERMRIGMRGAPRVERMAPDMGLVHLTVAAVIAAAFYIIACARRAESNEAPVVTLAPLPVAKGTPVTHEVKSVDDITML